MVILCVPAKVVLETTDRALHCVQGRLPYLPTVKLFSLSCLSAFQFAFAVPSALLSVSYQVNSGREC